MARLVLRILTPLSIVVAGVVAMWLMTQSATKLEPNNQAGQPLTVEVVTAEKKTAVPTVHATGVVAPAQQATLTPEVSGRIVALGRNLMPGGRLKKGDPIAWLDARNYELALKRERSRVRQAELELELERGRSLVAKKEWNLLGVGEPPEAGALVLRTSQLEVARQNLEAAKSSEEHALLNVERTVVYAPFDAIVKEKRVGIGQVVGPGTPVTTLVGTSRLWVRISVPMEKLRRLNVPGLGTAQGSRATVRQRLAGGDIVRSGHVLRLEGALDPKTRTARLLINVEAPFDTAERDLPLLPGAFVEVSIEGNPVADAFALPASALNDGTQVWLVDAQQRLQSRHVQLGWRTPHAVVVLAGLDTGDRVVTSPLAMPMNGVAVDPKHRALTEKPRAAQ